MWRTRRILATLVGAFALAGSAVARQHEERHAAGSDQEHEVAAVLEAVFAATESGDFAALDELYAGTT